MADLLYFREKWSECGPALDAVVQEDPKAPEAAESAYAAVLCYNKQYQQAYAGNEKSVRGKAAEEKSAKGKKGKKDQSEDDKSAQFRTKEFSRLLSEMPKANERVMSQLKARLDRT